MRFLAMPLLPAILLAIIACGGGDDDSGGGGSPLVEMLGAIPDEPSATQYLVYTDYERLRDVADVGSPGSDPVDINEWVGEFNTAVREAGVEGPWGGGFVSDVARETEAARAELGFDFTDVDQSIETGEPPATYHLLRGDFDAGDIDDAVHSDENFSDLLEEKSHSDLAYYSWGEDFEQDFERISPIRKLGVGSRLAVHDDLLYWCAATDGIEGMLDATTDGADSLADREDFAAMAEAMADNNVVAAQFSDQTRASGESHIPMLAYFESFAVGSGLHADGAYMVLAIANPDEETAVENVERLQSRIQVARTGGFAGEAEEWATGIGTVDAHADGNLTIAILRGPHLPWDFIVNPTDTEEPFLLHESDPE